MFWTLPKGTTKSTYVIEWNATTVVWQAFADVGHGDGLLVAQQVSTSKVPPAEGMLVHINLWMFQGRATAATDTIDVTFSDFRFSPAGTQSTPH
jgi:hypothetical protein